MAGRTSSKHDVRDKEADHIEYKERLKSNIPADIIRLKNKDTTANQKHRLESEA